MRRRLELMWRDVLDGLRTQGGRVLVASVAIVIGVGALVTLFALLNGLQSRTEQLQQELGFDVFAVLYNRHATPAGEVLEERHARMLEANLEGSRVSTMRSYWVAAADRPAALQVIATDSGLARVRQWRVIEGSFLDEWDLAQRRRSVAISEALSRTHNRYVGDTLTLGNVPFTVVGVVAITHHLDLAREVPDLALGEQVAFVPLTVAPHVLGAAPRAGTGEPRVQPVERRPDLHVDAIFVRTPPASDLNAMAATAARLLTQPDYRMDAIAYITPDSIIEGIRRLQRIVALTAGGIAALCLTLGGTTLLALMVINVQDRVREIGLRQALGASRPEIVLAFVLEACVVTGGAALVATLAMHLVLAAARSWLPVPVSFTLTGVFAPMAMAVALGVLFSMAPALSAARIVPAEALRAE